MMRRKNKSRRPKGPSRGIGNMPWFIANTALQRKRAKAAKIARRLHR